MSLSSLLQNLSFQTASDYSRSGLEGSRKWHFSTGIPEGVQGEIPRQPLQPPSISQTNDRQVSNTLPVFDPYSYANNYLQRQAVGVAPRLSRHPATKPEIERLAEFGVKASLTGEGSKGHIKAVTATTKTKKAKQPKRNIFQVGK